MKKQLLDDAVPGVITKTIKFCQDTRLQGYKRSVRVSKNNLEEIQRIYLLPAFLGLVPDWTSDGSWKSPVKQVLSFSLSIFPFINLSGRFLEIGSLVFCNFLNDVRIHTCFCMTAKFFDKRNCCQNEKYKKNIKKSDH